MDWLKLLISNLACWEGGTINTESLTSASQILAGLQRVNLAKGFRHSGSKIIIKLNKISLQFRTCRIKLSKFRFLFIDLKEHTVEETV